MDAGVTPLHASGWWWVVHKLNDVKHELSKFSAYTTHLTNLKTPLLNLWTVPSYRFTCVSN